MLYKIIVDDKVYLSDPRANALGRLKGIPKPKGGYIGMSALAQWCLDNNVSHCRLAPVTDGITYVGADPDGRGFSLNGRAAITGVPGLTTREAHVIATAIADDWIRHQSYGDVILAELAYAREHLPADDEMRIPLAHLPDTWDEWKATNEMSFLQRINMVRTIVDHMLPNEVET